VIKVSPRELLTFFDEKPPESSGHATAIVAVAGEELGVALLLEYLRSIGRQATALLGPVTPGTTKGARLDRWVKVSDQPPLLYQVEVKNSSAHAFHGKQLKIDADKNVLEAYARREWDSVWNGATFTHASMSKVLSPMKPPEPGVRVEPVICFWVFCRLEPFFTVPLGVEHKFREVHVFSMSAYLRTCGRRELLLEMPFTERRLTWLTRLFEPLSGLTSHAADASSQRRG
jgi:hypothetical protein